MKALQFIIISVLNYKEYILVFNNYLNSLNGSNNRVYNMHLTVMLIKNWGKDVQKVIQIWILTLQNIVLKLISKKK